MVESNDLENPRVPSYQPLVLALAAFVVGILIDVRFDLGIFCYAIAGGGTMVLGLVVLQTQLQQISSKQVALITGSLFLLSTVAMTSAAWHSLRWNYHSNQEIGLYASTEPAPVCLDAIVTSEPRMIAPTPDDVLNPIPGRERIKTSIRVLQIRDGAAWKSAKGNSDLIIHSRADHVRAGDRIRVFGTLIPIQGTSNPGQFDFRNFYRARDRFATVHVYDGQSVQIQQPASQWTGSRILSNLRRKLNEFTWRHVDPERAGFASAIMLGNREQLSTARRELFLTTGTVHLLAISGLHVGILAGSFFWLFRFGLFSRRTSLVATMLLSLIHI